MANYADTFPALSFDNPADGVLRITLDAPGLNSVSPACHQQLADVWLTIDINLQNYAEQLLKQKLDAMKGTVTKVDWANPHVHIFMNVGTGNAVANWAVELKPPRAMDTCGQRSMTMMRSSSKRDGIR